VVVTVAPTEVAPDGAPLEPDPGEAPAAYDAGRWEHWDRQLVAGLVLLSLTLFLLSELKPDLLLRNTTPNGGDTGGHVWWPAAMRDHVFSDGRVAWWSPDWYAGFPIGQYYFPVTAALIVLLDVIVPYNVAFKLVTAIGPLLLPIGAYVFARGLRSPWPTAPFAAAAAVGFLYFTGDSDVEFKIIGGNFPSTLAGEFSFTISLALALMFLGTLATTLVDRKRPWLPALLLALCVLTHVIVAAFAVFGAVIIWLLHRPLANLRLAVAVGGVGALLTAVWTLPMVTRLDYATHMGWEPYDEATSATVDFPWGYLLHDQLRWAQYLALVALAVGIIERRRATIATACMAVGVGLAFRYVPETRIWNARMLPFFWLMTFLLAAMGAAELIRLGRAAMERGWRFAPILVVVLAFARLSMEWLDEWIDYDTMRLLWLMAVGASVVVAGFELVELAGGRTLSTLTGWRVPGWAPQAAVHGAVLVVVAFSMTWTHDHRAYIPSWIGWNESGFEDVDPPFDKPAWPELERVIDTMGELPPGRTMWEYTSDLNNYGTTFSLSLLPFFTDGRIGSMEGLYFESSATTAFHFLLQAELSTKPSQPVRGITYDGVGAGEAFRPDVFERGIRHLRLFGVRYYMATSTELRAEADLRTDLLTRIAEVPDLDGAAPSGWGIYEVIGWSAVQPMTYEPVVATGADTAHWRAEEAVIEPITASDGTITTPGQPGWPTEWFTSGSTRVLAQDGPADWARAPAAVAGTMPEEALPPVTVSNVQEGDDWIEFDVDQVGVPVLVTTSYYPNWQADGAEGPYRVTPNMMVVVPTSTHVVVRYDDLPADTFGLLGSVLGLLGLGALVRWTPKPLPRRGGPGTVPDEVLAALRSSAAAPAGWGADLVATGRDGRAGPAPPGAVPERWPPALDLRRSAPAWPGHVHRDWAPAEPPIEPAADDWMPEERTGGDTDRAADAAAEPAVVDWAPEDRATDGLDGDPPPPG
jgi:hypothetical protein